MIEVYVLTEKINEAEMKEAELIGKEYKPQKEYTKAWLNLNYIEMIVDQGKDVYIIDIGESSITAKIHEDEIAKISKR